MTTIVGIGHHPAPKAPYVHLKAQAKESKVAIVACMRKLIGIIDVLVKTDQRWVDKTQQRSN